MDIVRELTGSAVLAAGLIAAWGFVRGRLAHVLPGLVAFVLILLTQVTVLASDIVERGLLGLLRWMAEGSSVLRTGSTIGVSGSAALYPEDPAQLVQLVHGFEEPLLLGLALLMYVPLIFSVLASQYDSRGFLVTFGVYFVVITGVGALWAHGIGTEMKFFDITWRYGSRGHWLSAIMWIGLIFGFPMALAKARESMAASEDPWASEFSLRGFAAQLFVMVTFGTVAIVIIGALSLFRAPTSVQVVAGLVCSLMLQAMLAGAADADGGGWSLSDAIESLTDGARETFSGNWMESVEAGLGRFIVYLLGTATIAGFFLVGGLTILSIFAGEDQRSIALLIGAGAPFLLLIGVPGSGEYLGALPGVFRSDR